MNNPDVFSANPQRVVSDARMIVRKHISDPNHIITDEEIASIRVGVAASGHANDQLKGGPSGSATYANSSWEIIE